MQRITYFVSSCDTSNQCVITFLTTFSNQPLHQLLANALSGIFRRQINSRFQSIFICGPFFPSMCVTISYNSPIHFVNKIRIIRRYFRYANIHFRLGYSFRLKSNYTIYNIFIINFRNVSSIFQLYASNHNGSFSVLFNQKLLTQPFPYRLIIQF